MKRVILAISLATLAASAHAEIFGTIRTPEKNIILADTRNKCPVDYNTALVMGSKEGKPVVVEAGCYRVKDGLLNVYLGKKDGEIIKTVHSFDDFVLSDYYRRLNPLAN